MGFSALELDILRQTHTTSVDEAVRFLADQALSALGEWKPPINLYSIARSFGIHSITVDDLPCDGLLIPRDGDGYDVVLSSESSWQRRRFSLAHEIGHAALHRTLPHTRDLETRTLFSAPGAEPEERMCDKFAAELLMPREHFEADLSRGPLTIAGIRWLAQKYQVSFTAAAYRVKDVRPDADFGVLRFVMKAGKAKLQRVLVNFTSSGIWPDTTHSYPPSSVPFEAMHRHQQMIGWEWIHEFGNRRRQIWMAATDVSANECTAIVARRDMTRDVLRWSAQQVGPASPDRKRQEG